MTRTTNPRPGRPMRVARTSVLVLAALVAPLAACGDDDGGGGGTMSAAEYRDAGNAVCRDADAAVSAALPEEEPTIEVARAELAPQLSRALSGIRDELDGLTPPAELADDHTSLLAALDSATDTLDRAVEDDALLEQLLVEGPPLDEIGTLAAQLGLTACAG